MPAGSGRSGPNPSVRRSLERLRPPARAALVKKRDMPTKPMEAAPANWRKSRRECEVIVSSFAARCCFAFGVKLLCVEGKSGIRVTPRVSGGRGAKIV